MTILILKQLGGATVPIIEFKITNKNLLKSLAFSKEPVTFKSI